MVVVHLVPVDVTTNAVPAWLWMHVVSAVVVVSPPALVIVVETRSIVRVSAVVARWTLAVVVARRVPVDATMFAVQTR